MLLHISEIDVHHPLLKYNIHSLVPRRRIELRTFCLQDRCSTTKATRAAGIYQFPQLGVLP